MTTSSTSPYRTLSPEETEDIASRILYEDNHVLVLNKRPGEIVQGDKTGDEPLVEKLKAFIALRDRKPGQVFMGVPHRLDRPVSGAVILAKTSKALTRLSAAFREGNAGKIYWALVENAPVPPEGEIRTWRWRWSCSPAAITRSAASLHPSAAPSRATSNTERGAPTRTAA